MDTEAFVQRVVVWAEAEGGVAGVALVGSHARGEARPDSDVDLMLLAPNPQHFTENPVWLLRFGSVASCDTEDWGPVTSLRVFYEAGLEVEYGFATPAWAALPVDAGTRRVVSDGMRVLYDPDGIFGALQREIAET